VDWALAVKKVEETGGQIMKARREREEAEQRAAKLEDQLASSRKQEVELQEKVSELTRELARARELEPEYQQAKSKIAYFEEIQARNSPWLEVNEKIASAFESVGDADRRFQGIGGPDDDGDNSHDSVSWWKATSQAHWQNALAWRSFAQDIGTQLAELKVEHRCTSALLQSLVEQVTKGMPDADRRAD
jgi:DNA repair exonuclease SbcCD ATPase subunit